MGIEGLDHIAIAVKDLDPSVRFFTDVLGFRLLDRERVESMNVEVAMLEAGGFHLELIEPSTEESGVARFLERKGEGIHHIALTVKGIVETLKDLRVAGVSLIDESPREGAGGRRVAFLHPRSCHGTLIELCEEPDS